MLPQTLLLLSLQLVDTQWPFPLLLNKCSNSTRLTELTSSRHPLKPASVPNTLLVVASRSVLLKPVFSFSFSLLPRPVTQLVLKVPSRSDGFKSVPAFPSSRPCSGPPTPTSQLGTRSSPRWHPHPVQSSQTPAHWYQPFILPSAPVCHHCEPSVLGPRALIIPGQTSFPG